jgi:hypothetical protein
MPTQVVTECWIFCFYFELGKQPILYAQYLRLVLKLQQATWKRLLSIYISMLHGSALLSH